MYYTTNTSICQPKQNRGDRRIGAKNGGEKRGKGNFNFEKGVDKEEISCYNR